MCLWESFRPSRNSPDLGCWRPNSLSRHFYTPSLPCSCFSWFLVFSLRSDFRVRLFDRPCSAHLQKEIRGRQLSKTTVKPRAKLSRSVDLGGRRIIRSEEHTSELQSLTNLVCRLLLEKKKKDIVTKNTHE